MLAHALAGDITCQAVEMNCGENSIQNSPRLLCDKTCNHPRENVPGSAGCHSRIACRIDPNHAIWLSSERAMAFEDENQLMLPREGSGEVQAVVLHWCACWTDEA